MPERVLVIEDERLVRDLIALNLRHAGYAVDLAVDFQSGLDKLREGAFDLGVVDVMLPGGDGFELVRAARAAGIRAPLLMLTARTDTSAKVRALDGGADDYLTKPFDVDELLARARALLRRARGEPPVNLPVDIGPYQVRLDSGEAKTREGKVTLSEKELRLLTVFLAHEDQPLTRADILEEVWGMDTSPVDRTVDNFVMRLRRLFEPDPDNPVHFVTLRGRGYLFRRGSP